MLPGPPMMGSLPVPLPLPAWPCLGASLPPQASSTRRGSVMWTVLVLVFQLRRRLILGVKRKEGQTEEVGRFIVADDYSPLIYSHPSIERDGRLQCSCFPLRAPPVFVDG